MWSKPNTFKNENDIDNAPCKMVAILTLTQWVDKTQPYYFTTSHKTGFKQYDNIHSSGSWMEPALLNK